MALGGTATEGGTRGNGLQARKKKSLLHGQGRPKERVRAGHGVAQGFKMAQSPQLPKQAAASKQDGAADGLQEPSNAEIKRPRAGAGLAPGQLGDPSCHSLRGHRAPLKQRAVQTRPPARGPYVLRKVQRGHCLRGWHRNAPKDHPPTKARLLGWH